MNPSNPWMRRSLSQLRHHTCPPEVWARCFATALVLAAACGDDGESPSDAAYAVGTAEAILSDPARRDAELPDRARSIKVRVWYPAVATDAAPAPTFLDSLEGEAFAAARGLPPEAFENGPATAREGVAAADGAFPVLVYSHGFGVPVALYAQLVELFVRRGFIVLGVTSPGAAGITVLEDGRVVESAPEPTTLEDILTIASVLAEDQRFVLDLLVAGALPFEALEGHVDATRVGAVGHSVGGAAAVRACAADARLAACVNFDGTFDPETAATGVAQPLFLVNADDNLANDPTRVDTLDASTGPRWTLELEGAGHNDFSDVPVFAARLGLDPQDFGGSALDPTVVYDAIDRTLGAALERTVAGRGPEVAPVSDPPIAFAAWE